MNVFMSLFWLNSAARANFVYSWGAVRKTAAVVMTAAAESELIRDWLNN